MTGDIITASIYCLTDPRDGSIRYVGKTIQPLPLRLQQHVYPAKVGKHNHSKARWIRGLIDDGVLPTIKLLDRVPCEQWREAESRWAQTMRNAGCRLTNEAPEGGGGDSSHKGRMTPEITALLGKIPDEELAVMAGLTRKAIAYHRKVRRISRCGNRPELKKSPPRMGGHNRIEISPEAMNRLGKEPDYVIAADLGITKGVIARLRKLNNIAAYAESSGQSGQFKKGNYPARWKTR